MATPVWTLSINGISGGSVGRLLAGCHITENATGTAYEFTAPNINEVLSVTASPLPRVPFTFPPFSYKGYMWTIVVISLGVGVNVTGTWAASAESGEYVAQPGLEMAEEDAASSASA